MNEAIHIPQAPFPGPTFPVARPGWIMALAVLLPLITRSAVAPLPIRETSPAKPLDARVLRGAFSQMAIPRTELSEVRSQAWDADDSYIGAEEREVRLLRAPGARSLVLSAGRDPEGIAGFPTTDPLRAHGRTQIQGGRTVTWSTDSDVVGFPHAAGSLDGVLATKPILVDPDTGRLMSSTDELIVRVLPNTPLAELQSFLRQQGIEWVAPAGSSRLRCFLVRLLNPAEDAIAVSKRLTGQKPLEWVTPNFVRELHLTFTPNDPIFPRQQHLNNAGAQGAVAGSDIDARAAWDIATGNSNRIIAILDDGVDTAHPDLAIYTNPGESGSGKESNALDDDGNGLVDDVRGWDFADGDNNPAPVGPNGHGTASAGVAAARIHNALAVAGIAGGCRILPVKVASNAGILTTDLILGNAISYAADIADVISGSWDAGASSAFIDAAIYDAATNGRGGRGCPVFFPSGNAASAWVSLAFPIGSDLGGGTFSFGFRYQKDASGQGGQDLALLDNVVVVSSDQYTHVASALGPAGRQDFEEAFPPAGWVLTSSHGANWTITTNEVFKGTAGTRSARSGVIGHNQWSELRTPNITFHSNDVLMVRVLVSSEVNYDGLAVQVYDATGTLRGPYSLLSGVTPVFTGVSYPGNSSNGIGVGASTDCDVRADYSQYGPQLDIVAPSSGGWNAVTTLDPIGSVGSSAGDVASNFSGTSAACPLAAGVGALMLSVNPALSADQVRTLLRATAEKIGPLPYVAGFHPEYGYGRVNARAALEAALPNIVSVSASDNTAAEPSNTAQFIFNRTGSTLLPLTLAVSVSGTAAVALDYSALPSTVNFPAGAASTALTVTPLDDSLPEFPESVSLTIVPGAGYSLGSSSNATLMLHDNDAPALPPPGVLLLDGVDDYASFTSSLWPASSTLASYTLEAWVLPTSTSGLRFIAADDAFDFDLTASALEHALYGSLANFSEVTTSSPVPGQWSHVAVSFDRTSRLARVALNGRMAAPVLFNDAALFSDPLQNFTLGARRLSPKASAEGFFQGQIDEVRLSDSVRYITNFVPAPRLGSDAATRALYHFDDPQGATSFADSSPNGRTLSGRGGARVAPWTGPETLEGPPVAYWPLDENSGISATDASGHGHEGILSGGPLWDPAGRAGGCLSFNGTSAFVSIPDAPGLQLGRNNADFSVAFWINLQQTFTGSWRLVMQKGQSATQRTFTVFLHPDSNRLHYRVSTTTQPNDGGNSTGSLTPDAWTHVAMIKSGSTLRLYLNGLLDSQTTLSAPVIHNDLPLRLSAPAQGGTRMKLDEVRLYARALDSLELQDLIGLVGYWNFAEGSGSLIRDLSAYHNDGFLGAASQAPGWILHGANYALSFDGVNDVVQIPHSTSLELGRNNADFSATFWVNLQQSFTGSWRVLMQKGQSTTQRTFTVFLHPGSNRLHYRVSTTAQPNEGGDSNGSLTLGAWTHVAMIKSGSTLRLFLNGLLDSQTTLSAPVIPNDQPLRLGHPSAPSAKVLLDELRLYNNALAPALIAQLASTPLHLLSQPTPVPPFAPLTTPSSPPQAPASATTLHSSPPTPTLQASLEGGVLSLQLTPANLTPWPALQSSSDLLHWSTVPITPSPLILPNKLPSLLWTLPPSHTNGQFFRIAP